MTSDSAGGGTRQVRAVAVQPKWSADAFLTGARFRAWMSGQLVAARPHLRPGGTNLVVLTELNGLPLVLRGGWLAARTGRFEWAAALLFVHHLPSVLPLMLRERVSPVRALQLAGADANVALYLDTCRDLAREYGVYLVCGSVPMPEYRVRGGRVRRAGSALRNQTVMLAPDGSLVGATSKVHLTPDEEGGGVDLSPGRLEDVRVYGTPAGELGVAISLDAFRADVISRLERLGCTVLLQPDANGSPWTGLEGIYPEGQAPRDQPLAWLESAWQVTATSRQIRYAVNPMVVGNLLDLTFDGQSAITGPADEAPAARGYVMTPPRPGFLALMPWVTPDGPRDALRALGKRLRAGSGDARENGYVTGVLHADLHLPSPPPPPASLPQGGMDDPAWREDERALAAYLRGEARFAPSGPLRLMGGWWPLALLPVLLWAARQVMGRVQHTRAVDRTGKR
ncbi:nitrilase-related carbon-nitrogen hydrolase [Deinococcus aquiradiocola]|uniref:nitrilase-related carbon-nitrogen hydrolase n=1 Tax=Deinococcus aquiradiocola TaxID=393059 RepID=UPI001E3B4B6A|nr:nitrilase-related carbon-nitrogen hydrolase [Deinococcus aquiradiocola]